MTRITNFGRKRTYIEAGFDSQTSVATPVSTASASTPAIPVQDVKIAAPETAHEDEGSAKKKRKRVRKRKPSAAAAAASTSTSASTEGAHENGGDASGQDGKTDATSASEGSQQKQKKQKKKSNKRKKEKEAKSGSTWRSEMIAKRAAKSEERRVKRIAERNADTTCFACREKGHAARDCPKASIADEDGEDGAGAKAKAVVGICYRCGSQKHSLSRCKKPANPDNPLPFASCFVCSGKGHLAGSCPQNKGKGVYPNGGSCKLCGETTHLAKDCKLRTDEGVNTSSTVLGTGSGAGADEDDFHTLKRRRFEVDKDEKVEERVRKMANVKAGAHSGIIKAFGHTPGQAPSTSAVKKKVVVF